MNRLNRKPPFRSASFSRPSLASSLTAVRFSGALDGFSLRPHSRGAFYTDGPPNVRPHRLVGLPLSCAMYHSLDSNGDLPDTLSTPQHV